jgi:hypothetical protein
MHDPGLPPRVPDADHLRVERDERIARRVRVLRSERMRGHACGLVRDDELRVRVEDRQREVRPRRGIEADRRRQLVERHALASHRAGALLRAPAVDVHFPLLDQPAHARPARIRQPPDEPAVEPLPALVVGNLDLVRVHSAVGPYTTAREW